MTSEAPGQVDRVAQVEVAVRNAWRGTAGLADEERVTRLRAALAAALEGLDDATRATIVTRLRVRNPHWERAVGGASTATGDARDGAGAGGRQATLERQARELQVERDDLRTQVATLTQRAEQAERDLEQRADEHRKLQKRTAQDREELLQARDAMDRSAAETQQLRRDYERLEKQYQQEAARSIRLDAELRALQLRLADAKPVAETSPPPPATAAEAPVALPTPVVERVYGSAAWEAFAEALVEAQLVAPPDVPPASEERDRRLGALAAALVRFEAGIEGVVLAQLEELKRRHVELAEHYDVLKYYRKSERTWWWSLTERAGRHVVPERHFAALVSHLTKMNYALLTAYFRTLSHEISKQARQRLDPGAIRRQAGTQRKDVAWDYFEAHAASAIPRELGDACGAEFAKVVDELYRYGTSSG